MRARCAYCTHQEHFHRLYYKLPTIAKTLRQWSSGIISDAMIQLHMAIEVIHRFDIAQEMSTLSLGEELLWCKLKKRILGLADIEHAQRKRAVRLNMIKFGDTTTRFFHPRITSRRRKKIHSVWKIQMKIVIKHMKTRPQKCNPILKSYCVVRLPQK